MSTRPTNIFLLFINMPNLEPNILFGQGTGRVVDNISKALRLIVSAFACQGLKYG